MFTKTERAKLKPADEHDGKSVDEETNTHTLNLPSCTVPAFVVLFTSFSRRSFFPLAGFYSLSLSLSENTGKNMKNDLVDKGGCDKLPSKNSLF